MRANAGINADYSEAREQERPEQEKNWRRPLKFPSNTMPIIRLEELSDFEGIFLRKGNGGGKNYKCPEVVGLDCEWTPSDKV